MKIGLKTLPTMVEELIFAKVEICELLAQMGGSYFVIRTKQSIRNLPICLLLDVVFLSYK